MGTKHPPQYFSAIEPFLIDKTKRPFDKTKHQK